MLAATGCASYTLGCSEQPSQRRREICHALAEHSEIRLAIKSIPLPGWSNEEGAIEAIYCELGISVKDKPELEPMRRSETRLGFLAQDLYELVEPAAERRSSLNDPAHPFYRLRNGCPAK